jgi:hypothetical protein
MNDFILKLLFTSTKLDSSFLFDLNTKKNNSKEIINPPMIIATIAIPINASTLNLISFCLFGVGELGDVGGVVGPPKSVHQL